MQLAMRAHIIILVRMRNGDKQLIMNNNIISDVLRSCVAITDF